jgi:hypothetical protein
LKSSAAHATVVKTFFNMADNEAVDGQRSPSPMAVERVITPTTLTKPALSEIAFFSMRKAAPIDQRLQHANRSAAMAWPSKTDGQG